MTIEFKPKVDNTASIAKDGVDVINISATNAVTFPTSPEQRIGVGQTWQNVIGSRTSGVPVTNTTGRPIMVSVGSNGAGSGATINVVVGGVTLYDLLLAVNNRAHATFIVPPATSYTVTVGGGAAVIVWAELR